MGCSACAKRKQGRIIPVSPTKPVAERQGGNTIKDKAKTLRDQLRYTGR